MLFTATIEAHRPFFQHLPFFSSMRKERRRPALLLEDKKSMV